MFEIVIIDYVYEPDVDGSVKEFFEIVKQEHPPGTEVQVVKGGARVTFIKEKKRVDKN